MAAETFRPTRSRLRLQVWRLIHRVRSARPGPYSRVVAPAWSSPSWTLYFCYVPDGQPTAFHRATAASLRAQGHNILIVAAAESEASLSPAWRDLSDALIWKSLEGYDFSGYAIGLRHLSAVSAGCDATVLNDSVIGPFCDLNTLFSDKPWDLVGLTSSEEQEAHIQSYAFMMRNLTSDRLNKLRSIFLENRCYSDYKTVVRNQECAFARVASRSMSVGSIWPGKINATMLDPTGLLNKGFPFIKRSHFDKFGYLITGEEKAELVRQRDRFLEQATFNSSTPASITVGREREANELHFALAS
ncbi:hypothetical protein [Sphingomonas sp. 1P08PE]|uniref:hypothetical protein n=1 Tax=Sphingomonas sp. 1P08PE TaxID=554122 RepID=UPI0039A297E7